MLSQRPSDWLQTSDPNVVFSTDESLREVAVEKKRNPSNLRDNVGKDPVGSFFSECENLFAINKGTILLPATPGYFLSASLRLGNAV